jgi:hypothetical protein
MSASLQVNSDPGVEKLLNILREYINIEQGTTPYLVKDGIIIIF